MGLRGRSALVLVVVLPLALAAAWAWLTRPLPADVLLGAPATPVGIITARDGRPLFQLIDQDHGVYRPATYEEIPQALRDAVVVTEDARFYRHRGVDARAILRAVYANLTSSRIVSGASTISQQTARNILLSLDERQKQTLWRKLREAVLAIRLERTLTKDEILTLYLNTAYYGRLATGVAAAAEAYFAKPVSDLSLAECAFLAGLPQAPARYDPANDPHAARERQRTVLDRMVAAGYLADTEAVLAAEEPLQIVPHRLPLEAPHFVAMVRQQVEALVPEDELCRGGLVVRTTLDLDLQRAAEDAVRRQLAQLNMSEPGQPRRVVGHAGVLVLDVADGGVLALVGSPEYAEPRYGAVNAVLAPRQPGSAVKPLLYLAAFERGYLPASMLLDVETAFRAADGAPYVPENYDLRYHGPVSARTALACSYNVAAVRLADDLGVEALLDVGRRLGIRSWESLSVRDLALALGAGELTLWELTQAYGVLARGGMWLPTHCIASIHAADGRLLYQASQPAPERVADAAAAYLVTDILADDAARAPAFGEGSVLALPFPAAVKTGTTTDWRDNWTVGYSSERVTGVWVGNADGAPMARATGLTGAAPIWREVMLAAHPQDPGPLPQPEGLVEVEVCALSGQLPGLGCVHRRLELFPTDRVPTATCELHYLLARDALTGFPPNDDAPSERVAQRVVILWPPEALAWAADEGLLAPAATIARVRPTDPEASIALGDEEGLRWLRPAAGTRYHLASDLPMDAQQIELVLAVADKAGAVTVLWNDEPWLTLNAAPYRAWWRLVAGQHCFVAEAQDVAGEVRRSAPLCIEVVGACEESVGG